MTSTTPRVSVRRGLLSLPILSAPTALAAFLFTQSPSILNPFHTGWLWGSGDIASSFTQWLYFRQTPLLQWPLTVNPHYGGDWNRTIIFTDTPPLFAVPLKYFLRAVSEPVQFTGLQILLSTYLLVLFTSLALSRKGAGHLYCCVSALLVATLPFLLFRDVFRHYSLNILWVVMASIYLVVRQKPRYPVEGWVALVFITLTWMPYFLIPILMLWLPDAVLKMRRATLTWRTLGVTLAAMGIAALTALVIDGYWHNSGKSGDFGFGYYNANLLTLVNPQATPSSIWSQFVPSVSAATDGQYEGFAYLGLGSVILGATVLTLTLVRRRFVSIRSWDPTTLSLAMSGALAAILSTALSYDLGPVHLFDIPVPGGLAGILSTFRSSGRFAMVLALIIEFGILVAAQRLVSPRVAVALVLGATVITYVDALPQVLVNKQQQEVKGVTDRTAEVLAFLDSENVTRVEFIPPEQSAYQWKMDILAATALTNIPVNDNFSARVSSELLDAERARTIGLFHAGVIPPGVAWAIYPEFAKAHAAQMDLLVARSCSMRVGDALLLTAGPCR